ncbi:RNA polymerase sigma factor [Schlesneria paludicola]|uniref:RNA polymerase sigma factor n=1 Tax=Schlesneria paludicola TaxID=360056 RepID=UPI000299D069|nr:sigma-70 family RNA polymerase sigma factor [Schlesneria paludicola]
MTKTSDDVLILAVRDGDRTAFAELVERYRDLVVGVAYSQVGDFARSEDIAQQAFITAWKRNFDLADPSRIAAWLCGIAKNLVRNERRQIARESSEPLDDQTASRPAESPEQQAIAREEAELLWSVLDKIPETYREPMILYYRNESTTDEVAAALDISPDVVRQRLSRGRKLLEEKVAEFVETTLSKRKVSHGFVGSILLALPASGAAKTAGVAATTGLTSWAGLGALLGPLVGIAGGAYGSKRSLDNATSSIERRFLWRFIAWISLLIAALLAAQSAMRTWFPNAPRGTSELIWGLYGLLLPLSITLGNRRLKAIKREHGTKEEQAVIQRTDESPFPTRGAAWNIGIAITGSTAWMFATAAVCRDWIGLILATALLAILLGTFVPRTLRASTTRQLETSNFHAVLAILAGTLVVAAMRWSAWLPAF